MKKNLANYRCMIDDMKIVIYLNVDEDSPLIGKFLVISKIKKIF